MADPLRPTPRDACLSLLAERYPQAEVAFLAGSVMRGQASPTSDLDIVVIFSSLPNARRESLHHGGWPVEAFVHDPQTVRFFFAMDARSGVPSMPAMVSEGLELPRPGELSRSLKEQASRLLAHGPAAWSVADLDAARYGITDLCDDLEGGCQPSEIFAVGARLYQQLGDFYFRSQRLWSATGKSLPRRLEQHSPALAEQFEESFRRLYVGAELGPVLSLAELLLAPHGGRLFAGYSREAPAEWRTE